MSVIDQKQSFDFPAVHTRVIFGYGTLGQLPALVKERGGGKVLVVSDPGVVKAGVVEKVTTVLKGGGIPHAVFGEVPQDSSTKMIARDSSFSRQNRAASLSASGEAAVWMRPRRWHSPLRILRRLRSMRV